MFRRHPVWTDFYRLAHSSAHQALLSELRDWSDCNHRSVQHPTLYYVGSIPIDRFADAASRTFEVELSRNPGPEIGVAGHHSRVMTTAIPKGGSGA